MNRYFILASIVVATGASAYRMLIADPPVKLQATTPGVQQVGNVNVNGAVLSDSLAAQNATRGVFGRATAGAGVTKPCVKVSWQVTGIRQDPAANRYRIQVESDKEPENRGKYLSPEAYDKPKEMGIHYRPTQPVRPDAPVVAPRSNQPIGRRRLLK